MLRELDFKQEEISMAEDLLQGNNTANSKSETAQEAKWYIVHTYSGYENKVLTTLKQKVENMGLSDQIRDVVIPVEKVREVVRKRVKGKDGKFIREEDGSYREEDTEVITEHKIFPSYVFIRMIMTRCENSVLKQEKRMLRQRSASDSRSAIQSALSDSIVRLRILSA